MVGNESCFWQLRKQYMPEVMSRFDWLRLLLKLESLAFPLEGIEWSYWGRPERIQESLARFGKMVLTRHLAASGI